MESLSLPDLCSVLIIKGDRLYAQLLRSAVGAMAPRARIDVLHTVKDATEAVARTEYDLVIAGLDLGINGDVLQFVAELTHGAGRARRVLIVVSQLEYRTLAVLQALPVRGVFDSASETSNEFRVAVRAVVDGQRYWSRTVLERTRRDVPAQSLCQHLSATEQLVLSVLGDGSDDTTAADALGVSPATISTIRRKLHRKLHVQHRGELIRVAAQNGYVRFTPGGIVRPGFAILAAECIARKRKRRAAAAAAVAAFVRTTSGGNGTPFDPLAARVTCLPRPDERSAVSF